MKRSRYRADQIVCIRGLDMPHGCAVLKARIEKHVWQIVVEQNGLMEEREITEGEIRPLTKREHGPAFWRRT